MLVHIFQSLEYLVKSKIDGAVVEFGVFQCGDAGNHSKNLKELKLEKEKSTDLTFLIYLLQGV